MVAVSIVLILLIALIVLTEMIIIIALVKRLIVSIVMKGCIGVDLVVVAMRDSLVVRVLLEVFTRLIVLMVVIITLESRRVRLVTIIVRKIHVSLNCVVTTLKAG